MTGRDAFDTGAPVDLCEAVFDDRFVRALPADPLSNNIPRQVRGACYSRVEPTAVARPRLLAWSPPLAARLGLAAPTHPEGPAAEVLAGNRLTCGMRPYAARYGGHQFGHWAGQLGDGRAITLGELVAPNGERWELQLKGAGRTPYSRTADGRAVLRSSVREFLCSEAMHHLGIPTTRALSLAATGESVPRDMFYDGHPRDEPGAVVCRAAPSFVRFGNFEILAALREIELLKQLADYVIREHHRELDPADPMVYTRWFEQVCRRTALMIAHWMRIGFVHGVMNTDNMSILGLTIDYGPYGWLEDFDPSWTPNTTDAQGRRYCFGNQPTIALWNLTRLAEALSPLISQREALESALDTYRTSYETAYRTMLAQKLGLNELNAADEDLVAGLFALLRSAEIDMTIFFRRLAEVAPGSSDLAGRHSPLLDAYYRPRELHGGALDQLAAWVNQYAARCAREPVTARERVRRMHAANPWFVLRNYLAQQAIEAAERGDTQPIETLLDVMQRPYEEQAAHAELAQKRPEWARHKPGCSALSCSS